MARLLLAFVLIVALSGCTDAGAPGGEAGRTDGPTGDAGDAGDAAAEVLRVDLERALGRFAMLGADALRATAAGDEDAAGVRRWWDAAAAEVHDVVAAVDPAAAVFDQHWDAVAELLVEDARATGETQVQRIDGELEHATAELGTAVAGSTGELWDPSEAAAAWTQHVQALRDYVRAHDGGEHGAALALAREEHARMIGVAQHWAQELAEHHHLGGAASSGRAEVRSALNQLFGEHAILMAMTVRQVREESPDSQATAAALNGNTEDVRTALSALLDAPTAERIDVLWRRQIDVLLRHALTKQQQDRAGDLTSDLAGTSEDLAEELAGAVDGLDAEQLQAALRDLHAAITAYGTALERDRLPQADAETAAAHRAATRLADLVAAAVAQTRPEDFPGSER